MFYGEGFDLYMKDHMQNPSYNEFNKKVYDIYEQYMNNIEKQAEALVKDLSGEPLKRYDNKSERDTALQSIMLDTRVSDFAFQIFDDLSELKFN